MKTFFWLVKREFWEHKGGFVTAPLVAGAIGFLLNAMLIAFGEGHYAGANFHTNFSAAYDSADLAKAGVVVDGLLYGVTLMILIVTAIVVFFYCLGSLYDDRRDRSVLFWKSLPLSDTTTVLSKLASAVIFAPAIAVVVGVVVGLALTIMFVGVASLHGLSAWPLLMQAHPFKVTLNLILLIPLYALWALPTAGWLMLCSAFARSKPFLWAIALPVGTGVLVSWWGLMIGDSGVSRWFWPNVVGRMLGGLIPAGWVNSTSRVVHSSDIDLALHQGDPAAALDQIGLAFHYSAVTNPSLYVGVLAGAAMIAGAIWFRRWRDDS
ncbi:hypothetical protein P3W33_08030 [Luteibacter sp. PPL552]